MIYLQMIVLSCSSRIIRLKLRGEGAPGADWESLRRFGGAESAGQAVFAALPLSSRHPE